MIGSMAMDKRTISITGKRQITIPQNYFKMVGFGKEAECILRNGEIVLRPVRENSSGEFAEQILSDLIKQGYCGEELLAEFKLKQKAVRPAIELLIEDAKRAAQGKGEFLKSEDVFE